MNLIRDLKKQIEDKRKQESMVAQLRKRSKESIARPKAEKISHQTILDYKAFKCLINGYIISSVL